MLVLCFFHILPILNQAKLIKITRVLVCKDLLINFQFAHSTTHGPECHLPVVMKCFPHLLLYILQCIICDNYTYFHITCDHSKYFIRIFNVFILQVTLNE